MHINVTRIGQLSRSCIVVFIFIISLMFDYILPFMVVNILIIPALFPQNLSYIIFNSNNASIICSGLVYSIRMRIHKYAYVRSYTYVYQ